MHFIQDRETGKLIPADQYHRQQNESAAVHGDIEAFVSPIDGSVIDDRAKLRAHNKKHDVVDNRAWGPDWFARKASERQAELAGTTKRARNERIEALKHAADIHNYRR